MLEIVECYKCGSKRDWEENNVWYCEECKRYMCTDCLLKHTKATLPISKMKHILCDKCGGKK